MPSTTMTTSVVCAECRHENEPERVYCNRCGNRLDRSAVKVRQDDVQDAQKRVKKLFDPRRDRLRILFFKISKVILGACAVAGLVQMILPPDVPTPNKTAALASQIRFDLENATTRHQPAQLAYSEDEVNAFLVHALKTKQKSLDKPLLDFKRVIVGFPDHSCVVTVERAFFGYPLFTSIRLRPELKEGKIVTTNEGGQIGRLHVDPKLARYMGVLFGDVRFALEPEARMVAKMGSVEIHDKSIQLTSSR